MIIVRCADDVVAGFEHEDDARRFLDAMRVRFEARRERRGLGKPETFNFLGFTFICGKSRQGRFLLQQRAQEPLRECSAAEIDERKECVATRSNCWMGRSPRWCAEDYFRRMRRATGRPSSRPCTRSSMAPSGVQCDAQQGVSDAQQRARQGRLAEMSARSTAYRKLPLVRLII
jgi:hypothetical protein